MPDIWLFGTFSSGNNNLDPAKTTDPNNAKWRSQVKVESGSQIVVFNGNIFIHPQGWVFCALSSASATVHAVYISDLEYQLRNTDPMGNDKWLKYHTGAVRISSVYFLFYRVLTTTEYDDLIFTPTATNPNPAPIVKPTATPKGLVGLGYLSFAETRLELGYDYGAVGGMGYQTEITEMRDDREQRNATRYLPVGRWQLGDRLIAESEADLIAEVSYLKQFHLDRLGSFQGFRFKDWSDFAGVNQDIATGNGVKTQFQLRKAYKVGNVITYRPIQKPVVGTVDVLVNGVNVATTPNHGWVVNHYTGVLSNPTPLANGAKLTANFQFDVPVWFESDEIGFRLQAYQPENKDIIYRLESIFVAEGRIPPAIPWEIQKLTEISSELDLGIIYETVEQYQFSTQKQELKSGYAIRESKREDSRLLINLGDRNYDQAEVDKILAYFWNARGSLAEFPFKNLGKSYKVRFATDQINFKFEGASDSDKLFNLSGLKLQLKEAPLYKIPPYNFAVQFLTVNPKNPNDPVLIASNPPLSGSNPGNVFTGSPNDLDAFRLGTYNVATGFDNYPPLASLTGSWTATKMFWAAGALWLFVTNNTNNAQNVAWYNRTALYKLNANGRFDYVESDLKNYFIPVSFFTPDRTDILKTPTGVSVFIYDVDASVAFPNGVGNNSSKGLLRFEIKNDGSQLIDFAPNTVLSPFFSSTSTFSQAIAVFGDKLLVNCTNHLNSNKSIGIRNGLNYIVGLLQPSSPAGFPLGNAGFAGSLFTSLAGFENNFYTTTSGNIKTLYFNGQELAKYYSSPTYNGSLIGFNVKQNQEGATFGKLILNGACDSGITCTTANSQNRRLIYIAPDFFTTPQLIDNIVANGNNTQATYSWLTGFDSGSSNQINHDKFGNSIFKRSNSIVYYQAGSSGAIDITSQVGSNILLMQANTDYGFALFSAVAGSLFSGTANPRIVFVQPQEA